jgi:hypothetical protein
MHPVLLAPDRERSRATELILRHLAFEEQGKMPVLDVTTGVRETFHIKRQNL